MADDEDDSGTEEETEDEWTPPTKEEWEKSQADLARTRAEAKAHRLKLREEREKAAGKTNANGSPAPSAGGQPTVDIEAERAKWQAETDKRIIGERARTALAAAGLVVPDGQDSNSVISRAVRMLDLDSCTMGDNGSVAGLEAEIDALKAQYPGMFTRSRRTGASADGGTAGRAGARSQETTGSKPNTASKLAQRWANGGRD